MSLGVQGMDFKTGLHQLQPNDWSGLKGCCMALLVFFSLFKHEREKCKLIYWDYYASVFVQHVVTVNLCHY